MNNRAKARFLSITERHNHMTDILGAIGTINLGVNLSSELLNTIYYGNPVSSYLTFGGFIFLGLILGLIIRPFLISKLKSFADKTKNKVDDMVYYILDKPFIFTLFIIGYLIGESAMSPGTAIGKVATNIGSILLSILVGWYAIRVVDGAVLFYLKPMAEKTESRIDDQLIPLISKAMKYTIIALDVLFILSNVGYDITSLIAGLGIGGLALAMASQEALSNLFGGVAMFSDRSFLIGDLLKVGKYTGNIEEMGLRSTRIRTFDGTLVTIPNKIMANDALENISAGNGRRIVVKLGLEYGTTPKKIAKAKELLQRIIKGTKGVDHKRITTAFTGFGDYTLDITFIYFIMDTSRYFGIKDEINSKILVEFNRSKIGFAYPTYTVYTKKKK